MPSMLEMVTPLLSPPPPPPPPPPPHPTLFLKLRKPAAFNVRILKGSILIY